MAGPNTKRSMAPAVMFVIILLVVPTLLLVKPGTGIADKRRAFVTAISNAEYAKGAMVLALSIEATESKYPLWVMVTNEVNDATRKQLRAVGCVVVEVQDVIVPGLSTAVPRWAKAFTKLRFFQLPLSKIVFLDSDLMLLQNIDYLFDTVPADDIAAAVEPKQGQGCSRLTGTDFNSGVVVASPTPDSFRQVIRSAERLVANGNPTNDQEALGDAFPDWLRLDYPRHGGYAIHCGCEALWEDVSSVHFTAFTRPLPKPWDTGIAEERGEAWATVQQVAAEVRSEQCLPNLYRTWNKLYEKAKARVSKSSH